MRVGKSTNEGERKRDRKREKVQKKHKVKSSSLVQFWIIADFIMSTKQRKRKKLMREDEKTKNKENGREIMWK